MKRIVIHNHLPERHVKDAKMGGDAARDELSDSAFLDLADKIGTAFNSRRAEEDRFISAGNTGAATKLYEEQKAKALGILRASGISGSDFDKRLQKLAPGKRLNVKMARLAGDAKTKDDDWPNDKIRRLYKSWVSGGQKPVEAIGELADNTGKSEQEIKRIVSSRDAAEPGNYNGYTVKIKYKGYTIKEARVGQWALLTAYGTFPFGVRGFFDSVEEAKKKADEIGPAKDAYFNTASSDPYQYKEGAAAARAGKPSKPPYPDDSEANKMWVAGFKSVGKAGDESNADEMKQLKKELTQAYRNGAQQRVDYLQLEIRKLQGEIELRAERR